jgi:phosphoglycerate dehydrogenase-like enzyme
MAGRKKVLLVYPLYADAERALEREVDVVRPREATFAELATLIDDVHCVISHSPNSPRETRIDEELLRKGKQLEILSGFGSGVDCFDIKVAAELGLPIIHAPGVGANPVSEHAIGLMLALGKNIAAGDRFLRGNNGWGDRADLRGVEITGKTLGLVGMGQIGTLVARRCRSAFDMRILVYDPFINTEQAAKAGAEWVADLHQMLRQCDYVSIHCPLLPTTRNLIGEKELAQLKPTAFLINTARGGIIDEPVLYRCLKEKRFAGAGLDSFSPEPPAIDNPLFQLPNVIATPHVAGASADTLKRLADYVVRNVTAALRGERPEHMVNAEAWPSRRAAKN